MLYSFSKGCDKMDIDKMIVLFIAIILIVWMTLGVVMNYSEQPINAISEASSHKRFNVIHREGVDNMSYGRLYILEDSSTGDRYLIVSNGDGVGVTPMVNKEASK
jgi:hypothetical protein